MALCAVAPGSDARASAARGGAAVRRGRRAALVAAGIRPRHPDPHLRRPALARLRRRALCRGDRRRRRARRTGPLPDGALLTRGRARPFFQPRVTDERGTLFEHCARALDRSLAVGSHGLPLMGTGDWNDGMNRVGEDGRGESVWLGWFLHGGLTALHRRLPTRAARRRGPQPGARTPPRFAEALERDAGTATGTGAPTSTTARRWAPRRTRRMHDRFDRAVLERDLRRAPTRPRRARHGVARSSIWFARDDELLLAARRRRSTSTALDPGYIKGYPPGIRENGGQYTHAAVWAVLAFADLGDGDKAGELFAMLNPINHTRTPADVERYKVEPYVVVADVYSTAATCRPRRLDLVHRLRGLDASRGNRVAFLASASRAPRCTSIPAFRIPGRVSQRRSPGDPPVMTITVENPAHVEQGVRSITLDGTILPDGATVQLTDDGARHTVGVTLGRASAEQAA